MALVDIEGDVILNSLGVSIIGFQVGGKAAGCHATGGVHSIGWIAFWRIGHSENRG